MRQSQKASPQRYLQENLNSPFTKQIISNRRIAVVAHFTSRNSKSVILDDVKERLQRNLLYKALVSKCGHFTCQSRHPGLVPLNWEEVHSCPASDTGQHTPFSVCCRSARPQLSRPEVIGHDSSTCPGHHKTLCFEEIKCLI